MILEPGEKVHIVERRYSADDVRRHLIGEVLRCTEQAIRLKGYVWFSILRTGGLFENPIRESALSALAIG